MVKEDYYKGQKSEVVTGGMGDVLFTQPVTIERSYENICLVRLTKSGDYGIYFMTMTDIETKSGVLTDPVTFRGGSTTANGEATEVFENLVLKRRETNQRRLEREEEDQQRAKYKALKQEKRDKAIKELLKERNAAFQEMHDILNKGVNKKLFEPANRYYLSKKLLQELSFLIK